MVLTEGCNLKMSEMHGVNVVKGHVVCSRKVPKGGKVNDDEPFREAIVSEERRPSMMEPATNVRRT